MHKTHSAPAPIIPPCVENPITTATRIEMMIDVDSPSIGLFEIEKIDVNSLGEKITELYNNVSNQCNETHQRKMLNCTYDDYTYDADSFYLYWNSSVICNSSCPVGDPLFGIDSPDSVIRMLQDFPPGLGQESVRKSDTKPIGSENATVSSQSDPASEAPTQTSNISQTPFNKKQFQQKTSDSRWIARSSKTVIIPCVQSKPNPNIISFTK